MQGNIVGLQHPQFGFDAGHRQSNVPSTTPFERLLLFAVAMLLPFDDQFPMVGVVSPPFLLFAALAIYVLVFRSLSLATIVVQPIFVAAIVSVLISTIIEMLHSNPEFSVLARTLFMYGGGMLIASLCRDRKALQAAIHGVVAGSVVLSVMLLTSSYSIVASSSASNFRAAGALRGKIAENVSVSGDLNKLAFDAAMGAAVALGLYLTGRSSRRLLFLLAALVCAVGAFIPMSRGAIVILALTSFAVLVARGLRLSTLVIVSALGAVLLVSVPTAVFSRMDMSQGGRMDVYHAVIEALPEYVFLGVGSGNYWDSWAYDHGIRGREHGLGAHNTFVQTTLYWGLLGLCSLGCVVLLAWRCKPKGPSNDGLRIAVQTLAVGLFLYLMVAHTIYDKEFSFVLGILVGGSRWIWRFESEGPDPHVEFAHNYRAHNPVTAPSTIMARM